MLGIHAFLWFSTARHGWRPCGRHDAETSTAQRSDSRAAGIIPTALSDDRFLRRNRHERPAKCPRKKGQWTGPLVLYITRAKRKTWLTSSSLGTRPSSS